MSRRFGLPIAAGTGAGFTIDGSGDLIARSENRDVNIDTLATTPTFTSVTAGSMTATGASTFYTTQGGGWKDMLGQIIARATGPGNPAWSIVGSGPFYAYKFAVNDSVQVLFHWPHDATPGSDFLLHAHWTTGGTSTNTVKWQFTYSFAKGFGQGAFSTTGTAVPVEQAASGTAWKHMTSEIASAIDGSAYEFDGLLLVNVKRITNGGSENADDVFLLMHDVHYQSNRYVTEDRTPLG